MNTTPQYTTDGRNVLPFNWLYFMPNDNNTFTVTESWSEQVIAGYSRTISDSDFVKLLQLYKNVKLIEV